MPREFTYIFLAFAVAASIVADTMWAGATFFIIAFLNEVLRWIATRGTEVIDSAEIDGL